MDGEWEEVKAKKPKKKPKQEEHKQNFTGGKNKKGELIAGAVTSSSNNNYFGGGDEFGQFQTSNTASHITDVMDEYGEEDYWDTKHDVEKVSHVCANAISEARIAAKMTQGDLAKKVGEKQSVIVDIENATAPYVAQ